MPLGMELGISPGDFVLDGDTSPSQKEGRARLPKFSAHIYCAQTCGCIMMPLGMEVGLGPGHIVPDGESAPLPQKGTEPPIFGPFLLSPNAWMHQDTTWYGGRPQPCDFVLGGDPAPYLKRGGAPPNFRPTYIVAKRLHESRIHLVGTREVGLGLRDIVRCGPRYPQKKGHTTPPNFWLMSIVAKWLDG